MKKNAIIAALIVITMLSSVYAFIQQTKAKAAQKQAEMNLELALTAQKQADVNAGEAMRQAMKAADEAKKIAEANMVIAMSQQQKAAEERARVDAELKKCRERK